MAAAVAVGVGIGIVIVVVVVAVAAGGGVGSQWEATVHNFSDRTTLPLVERAR